MYIYKELSKLNQGKQTIHFLKVFILFFDCAWSLLLPEGFLGYSLVAVSRLPIIVASLVAEHRLWSVRASAVITHRLSCPSVYGVFLDQGLNPSPMHWQADS